MNLGCHVKLQGWVRVLCSNKNRGFGAGIGPRASSIHVCCSPMADPVAAPGPRLPTVKGQYKSFCGQMFFLLLFPGTNEVYMGCLIQKSCVLLPPSPQLSPAMNPRTGNRPSHLPQSHLRGELPEPRPRSIILICGGNVWAVGARIFREGVCV